jgi:hypothetical protein
MAIALVLLSACSGSGNEINFTVQGPNWPWPWINDAKFFAYETFTEKVTVTGHINFNLDGVNGAVVINGQPGGSAVTVTAEARVGSDSFEDAQAGLDQLEISVTDNDSTIFVQTVQPVLIEGRQYVVDYTITVPSDLTVSLNTVNGHVTVNDMDNSVFVMVENGNVDFADIFGDVAVSVQNGSILGAVTLPMDGEAVVSTVNGDIDLDIPTTTSAELFGLVSNGTVSWVNLELMDVTQTGNSLHGTLGDGTGLIDLTTVNGNIVVTGF